LVKNADKFNSNTFPLEIEAFVQNNDVPVCLSKIGAVAHLQYMMGKTPVVEKLPFKDCSKLVLSEEK